MMDAIIFDVDGVLLDSVPSALRVRKRLLSEYGIDFDSVPDPHGQGHKGSSLQDFLNLARQQYPDVEIGFDKFAQKQLEGVYEDLKRRKLTADPALLELLESLREHHIPCAIASTAIRQGVDNKLDVLGIRAYFKVIISADDVAKHKPDPDVYLLAMQRLGAEPSRCIIFEDSAQGVLAGNAAGGKVVGFTKYTDHKNLASTIRNIDDWSEIDYIQLKSMTL
jgi:HAD superfamily hydrolase (TIGR01509 family)